MSDTLDLTIGLLTATTLALTLVSLAARFVLLPWLRSNLIEKVSETHHQVTVNAHASPEPTVLDKLDTLALQLDTHHRRYASDVADLWAAIEALRHPKRPWRINP